MLLFRRTWGLLLGCRVCRRPETRLPRRSGRTSATTAHDGQAELRRTVPAAAATTKEAPARRGLLLLLLAAVARLKVRVVGVAARGDEVCVSRRLRATRLRVSP